MKDTVYSLLKFESLSLKIFFLIEYCNKTTLLGQHEQRIFIREVR